MPKKLSPAPVTDSEADEIPSSQMPFYKTTQNYDIQSSSDNDSPEKQTAAYVVKTSTPKKVTPLKLVRTGGQYAGFLNHKEVQEMACNIGEHIVCNAVENDNTNKGHQNPPNMQPLALSPIDMQMSDDCTYNFSRATFNNCSFFVKKD